MSGTTSGVRFRLNGEDVDMEIFRGKSLNFSIIWGGSTPIDITGHDVHLQARDHEGRLMLDLSTTNGKVLIDGPAGRMTFTATPAETAAVNAAGKWEVEMTTPAGDVYRVASGAVRPIEEIVK